jgi:hypothetical protein
MRKVPLLIPRVMRSSARRLFGDLNRDVLGPSGDDKIIILSDSDEEEKEVREEKTVSAKAAPSSAARSPASTTSVDADDAPTGVQNDNSDDHTPDRDADGGNGGQDGAGRRRASRRTSWVPHCYSTSPFVQRSWDGDA